MSFNDINKPFLRVKGMGNRLWLLCCIAMALSFITIAVLFSLVIHYQSEVNSLSLALKESESKRLSLASELASNRQDVKIELLTKALELDFSSGIATQQTHKRLIDALNQPSLVSRRLPQEKRVNQESSPAQEKQELTDLILQYDLPKAWVDDFDTVIKIDDFLVFGHCCSGMGEIIKIVSNKGRNIETFKGWLGVNQSIKADDSDWILILNEKSQYLYNPVTKSTEIIASWFDVSQVYFSDKGRFDLRLISADDDGTFWYTRYRLNESYPKEVLVELMNSPSLIVDEQEGYEGDSSFGSTFRLHSSVYQEGKDYLGIRTHIKFDNEEIPDIGFFVPNVILEPLAYENIIVIYEGNKFQYYSISSETEHELGVTYQVRPSTDVEYGEYVVKVPFKDDLMFLQENSQDSFAEDTCGLPTEKICIENSPFMQLIWEQVLDETIISHRIEGGHHVFESEESIYVLDLKDFFRARY